MDGVIQRIKLKNFVTYSDVEFLPTENLNIIIGPNGTGKSTIVSAMILGLGGKTRLLKRMSNISEYIKSGRNQGYIEIQLKQGNSCVIITRTIFADNKSNWTINGKNASAKQVEEQVSSLNIQIDNLCQFLPQDRVHDFSKMNPQELLENTEKSVGSSQLYDSHIKLKELQKELADLEIKLKEKNTSLENEQSKTEKMSAQVKSLKEKQGLLDVIKKYEIQKARVLYSIARERYLKEKEKVKELNKQASEFNKSLEPLRNRIKFSQKKEREITSDVAKHQATNTRIINSIKALTSDIERIEGQVESFASHHQNKIDQEKRRINDIKTLQLQLSSLEADAQNYDDDTENKLRKELAVVQEKINQESVTENQYRQLLEQFSRDILNKEHEIREVTNQIKKAQDALSQRRMLLRRRFNDTYEAMCWLESNMDKFEGAVHKPVLMELNVNNPQYAKFVENLVPRRDLTAFTCEKKSDMNKFLKISRDQKHWKVNVVHSGEEHPPVSAYQPPIPIEHLQKYGIHSYLKDVFSAPAAIMKYLCRTYSIYKIPLGNSLTDKVFNQVPGIFVTFMSESYRYRSSVSKYSKEKLTTTHELAPSRLLSNYIDIHEATAAAKRNAQLVLDKQCFEEKRSSLNSKWQDKVNEINELKSKKKELSAQIEQIHTLQSRISLKKRQISSMEQDRIDIESSKKELDEKVCMLIDQRMQLIEELLSKIREFQVSYINCATLTYTVEDAKNQTAQLEKEYNELERKVTQMEKDAKEVSINCEDLQKEVKDAQAAALKLTGGKNLQDIEVPADCGTDLDRINALIQECKAKAEFLSDDNEGLLKEYEIRKKRLHNIKKLSEDLTKQNDVLKKTMDELMVKWMTPLNKLISTINSNFGKYFAQLKCAGEVVLRTPKNVYDFDQYGLLIKVKFRDGDELQELNQNLQSGGERSVSTAIFMLAIQELTRVPFRVVDEINQGMDPLNERRVFELLVNITTQPNTSQYFVLTPKLLPNLTYKDNVMVHCVFNGLMDAEVESVFSELIKKKRRSLVNGK